MAKPIKNTDICYRLLFTIYMGTKNSSIDTERRSYNISKDIGSHHYKQNIDDIVQASMTWYEKLVDRKEPLSFNNSHTENIALQNIQARVRMIQSYLAAQLLCESQGRQGNLLVLGTSNVDESLRGFLTKYDNSSADLNPIGGICKTDLKKFLLWSSEAFNFPSLKDAANSSASPELVPINSDTGKSQASEDDMGLTFEQLGVLGKLRRINFCGPVSMFKSVTRIWDISLSEASELVKHFFRYYSINRHKATVITPSYHAENYSPDDNRYDLRQFLYNNLWPRQFRKIDEIIKESEKDGVIIGVRN